MQGVHHMRMNALQIDFYLPNHLLNYVYALNTR